MIWDVGLIYGRLFRVGWGLGWIFVYVGLIVIDRSIGKI